MSTDTKALIAITDDVWIQRIIEKLFQHCTYRLLHVGKATVATKAVWDVKEAINLILTNFPRAEQVGRQLSHEIEKFGLPFILMGLKEDLIQWKGEEDTEVVAYLLYDLRVEDLIEIWNSETEPEYGKNPDVSGQVDGMTEKEKDESEPHKEERRGKEVKEQSEEDQKDKEGEEKRESHGTEKRPRMTWTKEMHDKFVEIFDLLGPDKAYPKKITELMNHPGLTRESVASHLQKYRLSLRKAEEEYSKKGTDSKKNVKRSSLPPHYPRSDFNTGLGYDGVSGWTSGSLLPSPPHFPTGNGQGQYQQQYYSSLTSNQIIPQESFNNLLTRSQLPGSVSPLQPQPNNPVPNYLSGSQNCVYNQVLPDPFMQSGNYQNIMPNLYHSNSVFAQNSLRPMNNIALPHAPFQPSGMDGYNAPIEGPTAPVRQFSTVGSSGIDHDAEFGVVLNQMGRAGPQFFPEQNRNQDPNFDQAN